MKGMHAIFLIYLVVAYTQVNGKDIVRPDDPTGTDQIDWWQSGQEELTSSLKSCYNVATAKNVILFVGDGMGVSTVTAARWLQAQRRNVSVHAAPLSWERFPHVALSKTYCANVKTPDSAATATAYLSGHKARKGTVGVDQHVHHTDCSSMKDKNKVQSILHKSHIEGKWTGVVTTTRATHATPAAAFAHTPDRGWEVDSEQPEGACVKDIAYQLVKDNNYIRVFMSGGRAYFLPDNETDPEHPHVPGLRRDRRNLLQEWLDEKRKTAPGDKTQLVMNETDFKAVDDTKVEYLMGLFEPDHMQYETDRKDPQYEVWGEPSLAEMTEKAIHILKRSDKGFFLLVEGGRIDHAHHDGNAYRALDDTLAMAAAVQAADKLTDDDTLIVVTADHSHTFTIGGYPTINKDIFDVTDDVNDGEVKEKLADDGLPVSILAYANGPGYVYHFMNDSGDSSVLFRRNLTDDSLSGALSHKDYRQPAGVPLNQQTHGGEDVAIYARGPMSHLFHGTHEQNYIAHVMMYASCVGDNKAHCQKAPIFTGVCESPTSGTKGQRAASLMVSIAAILVMTSYTIGLGL